MATARSAAEKSPPVDADPTSAQKPKPRPKPRPKRRQTPEQKARAWTKRLERTRPGLLPFVLDGLVSLYGRPIWQVRLDPISELVLTILTQNTADVNAEKAFEALRQAYPSGPSTPIVEHRRGAGDANDSARRPDGWGGEGLPPGRAPNWAGVEAAPVEELIEVIRHGGLAYQKAPRIQAALRTIREERGDYDLAFLRGLPPIEARDWLTRIPGIGKKTASIVLLFCFGMPLMPVDTHVERVSRRIGLAPPAAGPDEQHEIYGYLLAPDQFYAAHVLLIQHGRRTCDARRPACDRCPIAPRCRSFDPRAE
jgi:endonuclease-3